MGKEGFPGRDQRSGEINEALEVFFDISTLLSMPSNDLFSVFLAVGARLWPGLLSFMTWKCVFFFFFE